MDSAVRRINKFIEGLGAEVVHDYNSIDYIDPSNQYDFILDDVGKRNSSSLKENLKQNLQPNGRYDSIDDVILRMDSNQLESLCEMIEQSDFDIVIDKTFNKEDIREAHDYVENGLVGM